jgi:uncharacterized protein (TIGR02246 family)
MSESLEARVGRLEDLLAINQLFIDYGEYLDAGDFEAYAGLFAEDGQVRLGPMGTATGRAEIQALMTAAIGERIGQTFHIVSSPRIALAGDRAQSTVMWSVASLADDGLARVTMVGHHLDELVKHDGRWYFQRRKGVVNLPGRMPAEPPVPTS